MLSKIKIDMQPCQLKKWKISGNLPADPKKTSGARSHISP